MTISCNKWKYWSKTCTTYSMTVKKFAYCIKAKNQTKRKPSHSRKWLFGLRYSGSFLKISLHVQYSKKKNSDWKKKINHESRLCYKVHVFLEEFEGKCHPNANSGNCPYQYHKQMILHCCSIPLKMPSIPVFLQHIFKHTT